MRDFIPRSPSHCFPKFRFGSSKHCSFFSGVPVVASESANQFFIVRIVPKRSRLSSAVTNVRSMT
jgi:hypothetical protein